MHRSAWCAFTATSVALLANEKRSLLLQRWGQHPRAFLPATRGKKPFQPGLVTGSRPSARTSHWKISRKPLRALVPLIPSLQRLPNTEELVTILFQISIFPYAAFLYLIWTRNHTFSTITKIGFTYLLVFVFATIIAGVVALRVYHEKLANVDYLHGTAEMLLTMTNICILLGLKEGPTDTQEK